MDSLAMDALTETVYQRTDEELPKRVEGWMYVMDVGSSSHRSIFLDSNSSSSSISSWICQYCVLQIMGSRLTLYASEKDAEEDGKKQEQPTEKIGTQLEGELSFGSAKDVPCEKKPVGKSSSRRERKSQAPVPPPPLNDSGYEKSVLKERRGSVPAVVPSVVNYDPSDALSPPNRLMSFISRKSSQLKSNLKRAKSATKLEPKKSDGVITNGDSNTGPLTLTSSLKRTMSLSRLSKRWHGRSRTGQDRLDVSADAADQRSGSARGQQQSQLLSGHSIRASHSHESLLTAPNIQSFDLSMPVVQIKPLQSGVLGQEHCFQVSTSNTTKFFSCRTAEERQKWMEHLKRTVEPFQEQTRRVDLSLELWILEAKGFPAKHKYFCEIYLDSVLYGRTSSKVNGNILFWGEQFDFSNLPTFDSLVIKLYKEGNRSKRKEINIFIGQVKVQVDSLGSRQLTEKWYPVMSSVVGRIGKDAMLRMKARYHRVEILPINIYQPLIEYIKKDYRHLVTSLEVTLMHVREKEEIARSLVGVMQKCGCAKEFLVNIIIDEINRQDNAKIFLRSNSIATKAIDAYMKLVGEKYLHDTLSDFIQMVLESPHSFEVDPKLLTNGANLDNQQDHLRGFCQRVWYKIFNSHSSMPAELKLVFSDLKKHLLMKTSGDEELCLQLISSCLFLRFLCPAILSPSMFGLTQVFPQDKDARNLTLITKAIQGLANFTKFGGGKEDFMIFMNDFVEMEASNLRTFLNEISKIDSRGQIPTDDCCFIDLGREVSVLHSLLLESSKALIDKAKTEQKDCDRFNNLTKILSDITEAGKSQDIIPPMTVPRASTDSPRNRSNSSSSTPGTPQLPPLDTTSIRHDPQNGSASGQMSATRYVSNTSFKLANSSASSSDTNGLFFDIPRTRNTMREMQDSDQYISLTSEKTLPVLPPMTSASVLFSGRSFDRPPADRPPADRPPVNNQTGSHLVYAAETVSNDFSADVLSMIDSMLMSMTDSTSSSSSSQQQKGCMTGTSCQQQPLAFSNPLFSYPSAKQSLTPPIASSGYSPFMSENKSKQSSMNGISEQGLSPTCVRNASPSPSLGQPPIQRAGMLFGFHSHENLPHHKGISSIPNHAHARNSVTLAASDLDSYFAMASGGVLSRSMEFPLPPPQPTGPDSLLKRNNTDSLIMVSRGSGIVGIDTPPESPTCGSAGYPTGRRNGLPQGTVRMGVRSMQRKLQETEKSKQEYELELRHLRQQVAEMRRKMEQEKVAAVTLVQTEWCQKYRQMEEKYHQMLDDKDSEISNLQLRLSSYEQQNQHNETTVKDFHHHHQQHQQQQHQVKEMGASLGSQKSRVLPIHSQTFESRQCKTH